MMISVSESATQRVVDSLQDAILSHVVPGLMTSSQLEDEQVLETEGVEGSSIRINYFSVPEQVSQGVCGSGSRWVRE